MFPTDPSKDAAGEPEDAWPWVGIYRGPRASCREFALVLEAAALPYRLIEDLAPCELWVPQSQAAAVREELARYAAERRRAPEPVTHRVHPHAGLGAVAYGALLIAIAYCAGIDLFGVDWLDAGAIDPAHGLSQWWRALTALTLHLSPEHLYGNLLFGIGAGVLASRLFGAGIAWLSILLAATIANLLELAIAPPYYRAAGASTAVFAALGLLTGYAWRLRGGPRERWLYRAGPLAAGLGLLALLGTGKAHVDLLGHLFGFLAGLACGAAFARARFTGSRRRGAQLAAGAIAIGALVLAWTLALHTALLAAAR
ncbi:MAG: rhomboid family intramembrane serine protease [Gammaproteobacteria bacterium]|nr:rhomboid family intramembrane serine protease [Gammaproteobacteria bacterium]